MYYCHFTEEELIENLLPYLKNILVTHDGHIAHFCPFCQANGRKENGREWSDSKRKGYLLLGSSDMHQNTVFYCHNDKCYSRSLVDGRKALPLDVYADYVLNHCFEDEAGSNLSRTTESGTSTSKNSRDLTNHQAISNVSRSMIIRLKPSTLQQQSRLGGQLDRRIKDRKHRQRCLWTGYADRKAGKP